MLDAALGIREALVALMLDLELVALARERLAFGVAQHEPDPGRDAPPTKAVARVDGP